MCRQVCLFPTLIPINLLSISSTSSTNESICEVESSNGTGLDLIVLKGKAHDENHYIYFKECNLDQTLNFGSAFKGYNHLSMILKRHTFDYRQLHHLYHLDRLFYLSENDPSLNY